MSDLDKLQWRCRRGTLELDTILERYLLKYYPSADAAERQAFVQLLELQDSELLACFFSAGRPASVQMASLVEKIRNLSVP